MKITIESINYETIYANYAKDNDVKLMSFISGTNIDTNITFENGCRMKGTFIFPYEVGSYEEAEIKIREYFI